MIWQLIVLAMVGYLIGSVNLSIVLGHLMGKGDIREQGSGNAGTTNTLRVLGKGAAALVLVFDIFKAVIAILAAKAIFMISGVDEYVAGGAYNISYELGILVAAFRSNSWAQLSYLSWI